jgi:hypothetical protein
MKRLLVALALLASLTPLASRAETLRDSIEVFRAQVLADRKAVVAASLDLTDAESVAFWPLYDEYQDAVNKLRRRRVNLILDYADAYPAVTDEKAHSLLAAHLAIKREWAQAEDAFAPRFEKILPAKKAARYYQIENKIDAIINYELAAEIPLVQ